MLKKKYLLLALVMMPVFVLLKVLPASAIDIGYDGKGLEDGKFRVLMAPPKNLDEKYTLNEMISDKTEGFGITAGNEWHCNDDFTACKLVSAGVGWSDEEYDIEYLYDETVEEKIDAIVENLEMPEDGFLVYDTELVKYWVFGAESLGAVSSEVKTALHQYNMYLSFDTRGGAMAPLEESNIGLAKVYYDGILYAVIGGAETGIQPKVVAPHIFYVPTGTSEEDKGDALIERFVDIYGDEVRNIISVNETSDVAGDLVDNRYERQSAFDDYLDEKVYELNIDFGGMGDTHSVIIVADSDKMNSGFGVDSTDLRTEINIKTGAVNLPGDAATYAQGLGNDFEEIEKALGTDVYYAYELGLYSPAVDDQISDAPEGEEFTVSIPVPASLQGIELLSAYWINFETGEPEEHYASIVDGVAIYTTNHFSTYILAESSEDRPAEESEEEAEDEVLPDIPGAPNGGGAPAKLGESLVAAMPILGMVFIGLYVAIKFARR